MPTNAELFSTTPIPISVGDLAVPEPLLGSLESHSGFGAAAEGLEIHQRVQRRRAKADASYQAEVPVCRELEWQGHRFQVKGRMDGVFRGQLLRIEEIKTSFSVHELARRLAVQPEHPYCLQLRTYGYFHWLETGEVPELTLHLVSSRNGRSEDLTVPLNLPGYQAWLERRLEALAKEARLAGQRSRRRRQVAAAFAFPFPEPRPGQRELMQAVNQSLELERVLLLQAATGLGKTVGVLHPVLTEALGRGQQVCYVTPKNSQHAVAEDAVARFRKAGAPLKSLCITAKQKICLQDEPVCHPDHCEYARDYYTKLAGSGLGGVLVKKKQLGARTFRKLGREFGVCPFELQLLAVPEADVVICDYNYVFAPRSALGRVFSLPVGQSGKPNLVVDEVHNLPARGMEYYSPALYSERLAALREGLIGLPRSFGRKAGELLEGCLQVLEGCWQQAGGRSARIEPPVAPFLDQDARLRALQSQYLESSLEIGKDDPLLALCRTWSEFTETLQLARDAKEQEFFSTVHRDPGGVRLKITCCDASRMLAQSYQNYRQVVGFSATLKPFEYYARLSGLDPETTGFAEFATPFPPELRKLLIIPQVSTKYAQRERNYAKIAEAIARIAALRPGNYFAFFPSFAFLERVAGLIQAPPGFQLLRQERSMSASRLEGVLESLRQPGQSHLVCAVQGGSFSEGIDYLGDMVIGTFVVGPPLPNFDLEREEMRDYYQRRFNAGFDYAYAIPAMAKAVQAAGRVIRSETDSGLIVLMDDRFLEPGFSRCMPGDWFATGPAELVKNGILQEVARFWESLPPEPTAAAEPRAVTASSPSGENPTVPYR
jgi:DNA excision repair protein ERCC-2